MPNKPWFLISAPKIKIPQIIAKLPLEPNETYLLLDYDGVELEDGYIIFRYKPSAIGKGKDANNTK